MKNQRGGGTLEMMWRGKEEELTRHDETRLGRSVISILIHLPTALSLSFFQFPPTLYAVFLIVSRVLDSFCFVYFLFYFPLLYPRQRVYSLSVGVRQINNFIISYAAYFNVLFLSLFSCHLLLILLLSCFLIGHFYSVLFNAIRLET